MTARPAAFDARILDKLAQVTAIARHNGWGTAADVARVAQHLRPHTARPDATAEVRRAQLAERRALIAERQARELRAQLNEATRIKLPGDYRVVDLPSRQADVLTLAAEGVPRSGIADRLGITNHCVNNTLYRAARRIGAINGEQAVALVAAGRVEIHTKNAA